jgi:tetratricopeptide (TPR) repeat protein
MSESTPTDDSLSPSQLDQVIALCDRFEAAWKSGTMERLEDLLPGVPESLRPALFRQLLALELELRRKQGERPAPAEYRNRFPDRAVEIGAIFAEAAPGTSPTPPVSRKVPHSDAARNLLFGLLAFQNGFIDRDALLGAFNAWVADKSRLLGDLLRQSGTLDAARHDLTAALVAEHLKLHAGDAAASLADLSSVDSARAELKRVSDADLRASLAVVGANRSGGEMGTDTNDPGGPWAGERFRILRFHRKGGLGQIHVARDEELGRDVALKEILPDKAHIDQLRSRFVLEAEINGGLEHPGIVPIYSLGTYADGRPFYAMRFVEGDSLKDAIEAFHREHPRPDPSTAEFRKLLARFIDVCETIAYAHSRGVLHRDLKPQNIMLGRYGEALIIDWGLAKAIGRPALVDDVHEATLSPASGDSGDPTIGAIGSPPYMSPEQATGAVERLGQATDVYGLGATLYHVLTGRPPIRAAKGEAVESVLEKVRRGAVEPPRSIKPGIPAALEAICVKSLALRAENRYASAKALAEDVEHWLADEPVSARQDPPLARAARWGRKHRTAVASAVVLLATGLTATMAALVLVNREREQTVHERDRAIKAEGAAVSNMALAQEQERKAKRSESEARTILSFLQNKVLAAARPEGEEGGLGHDVLLRAAVDTAEASIAEDFHDQPAVEAAIRETLGGSYLFLGAPDKAIPQHERARAIRAQLLGPEHPDTLHSMYNLASAYLEAGRGDQAMKLQEETLRLMQSRLGPDHPHSMQSLDSLGSAYFRAGRAEESVQFHAKAAELRRAKLGPDHPDTLLSMSNLAGAHWLAGRTEKAIRLDEEVLRLRRSKLGAGHSQTLTSLNNLAGSYLEIGRTEDAIRMYDEVLALRRSRQGSDHPHTLSAMSYLGAAYLQAGQTSRAVQLHEAALGLMRRTLSPSHPDILQTMDRLAVAYEKSGQIGRAVQLHEETLGLMKAKLGPDHPDTLTSMNNLAVAYYRAGRTEQAIEIFEALLESSKSKLGPDHPETLISMNNLARAYLQATAWTKAERTLRECLDLREKQDPDGWLRFHTLSQLGAALAGQRKLRAAEPLLIKGLEGLKRCESTIPATARSYLTQAGQRLVSLYHTLGEEDEADKWRARLGLPELPTNVFSPL